MKTDQEPVHTNARGTWATRAMGDIVISSITLLVGIAMMYDSNRIGAGWSNGNLQSGYFPYRLGIVICIISAAILLRTLLAKNRDTKPFVEWSQLKRVLAVGLPTLVYILVTQWLGIYVASAIFIGAFMRVGGKHGWVKTITVSVCTSITLFVLFEIAFLVPLPKGPLEAMLGY